MSAPAASPSLPPLPADLAAAHAMILSERAARIEAEASASHAAVEALQAKAAASATEAMIAHLTLQIAKLRRELYVCWAASRNSCPSIVGRVPPLVRSKRTAPN